MPCSSASPMRSPRSEMHAQRYPRDHPSDTPKLQLSNFAQTAFICPDKFSSQCRRAYECISYSGG